MTDDCNVFMAWLVIFRINAPANFRRYAERGEKASVYRGAAHPSRIAIRGEVIRIVREQTHLRIRAALLLDIEEIRIRGNEFTRRDLRKARIRRVEIYQQARISIRQRTNKH